VTTSTDYRDLQSEEENIADTSREGLHDHQPKVINGDSTLLFSKSHIKKNKHLVLSKEDAPRPPQLKSFVDASAREEEKADELILPVRLEQKKMSSPIQRKSPPPNYSGQSVKDKGKLIAVPPPPESLRSP